MTETL